MLLALPFLGLSCLAEEPALAQRRPNILQQLLERAQQEARRKREAPQPIQHRTVQQNKQRQVASPPSSVALCDNQASHPDDPMKRGVGISDEDVDLINALTACTQAVSEAQTADSPRIMFQTGRVLWLAEEFDEAMPFFLDAAEANEPAAMAYLGDAYANGLGGAVEDRETALTFYTQAAQAGFTPANEMANELAEELAQSEMPKVQIAEATPQQVNDCDRLAANPSDPKKLAPGVADASLDSSMAVAACDAATVKFPGTARLDYQYGRALYLDGELNAALPLLASSAEKGYAAAKAMLGDVYLEGLADQPQDFGAAYSFYKEASTGGYVPAAAQAKELEALLAPEQSTIVKPLRLSCEVRLTHSGQMYDIIEQVNSPFSIELNFATNKVRQISETGPGFNDKTAFLAEPTNSFELASDGGSAKIQVNPFGRNAENAFMTIDFNDGKAYMHQRFEAASMLGFALSNSVFFEGYCGEQVAPAPKPVKKKK
ncbi:hypothetical protein [Novosphingobium sp.]|uniref:hypothetical protein n=1 Tax=Novosphingobium sp. TaxID=1874826 RepID=UPI003564EFA0